MSIKSLLLGSAAALVAVSGARAADAIVAEPEPVEYVRVCDAYGAGFFYIPGTETCLAIGGYVYVQFTAVQNNASAAGNYYAGYGAATGWYNAQVRARLNVDARSDTEWGTLRSYIRVQSTWNPVRQTIGTPALGPVPGDGIASIDQAFIQLGGFLLGYTESAYLMGAGFDSINGGYYGYQQRLRVSYTFAGNGLSATISLEDDGGAGAGWVPDIVATAQYAGGWGRVFAGLGYDESDVGTGISLQAGVDFNIPNTQGTLRVVGYWNSDAATAYGPGNTAWGFGGSANWSILASYTQKFSNRLSGNLTFQYMDGFGAVNLWVAGGEAIFTPVTNFTAALGVFYVDDNVAATPGSLAVNLRFTRSF